MNEELHRLINEAKICLKLSEAGNHLRAYEVLKTLEGRNILHACMSHEDIKHKEQQYKKVPL